MNCEISGFNKSSSNLLTAKKQSHVLFDLSGTKDSPSDQLLLKLVGVIKS